MKPTSWSLVFVLILLGGRAASGQLPVSEIKLRTDPADARVRPYENIVIQVLAYGEASEGDAKRKVRLQKSEAKFRVVDSGGGWLSKPFRFQGNETEPFYQAAGGRLSAILGRATGDYVLQDAVMYTAPERPGKYTVEAQLDGKTASILVDVDRGAPSRRPRETTAFGAEPRPRDPYRQLAERYAPFIAQETWWQPKSDYIARFDLDGDWRGDNNWDQAEEGSSQAYVHYAAMETKTHWFLVYNLFHPRDYSDKCVAGSCHENDNEGLILTIEKDGSAYGRLQVMETLAHNNVYSYNADSRVTANAHNLDGGIELHQGAHPVVFVESGGHGIYGSLDSHSRYSLRRDEFPAGTGVTYVYKGAAERPKHSNDRNVGYELLPIYDHWWARQTGEAGSSMFDAWYDYAPYGGRPRSPQGRIAGSFLGRKLGSNKAKPFWGWHDGRTEKRNILAAGQWALDPAYGVTQNLRLPGAVSLDYVFNPYLGIGGSGPASTSVSSPAPSAAIPAGGPAQGAAVDPTAFRPKRSESYDPDAKRGRFDLRFYVDGEVEIDVRGDAVRFRMVSGRPPRDDGSEFSQPIPRAKFRSFGAEQKDGRGSASLIEEPSPQNDFTARVRISDTRGGDDRYHVRLEWEWDELLPAPVASQPPAPAQPAPLPRVTEPYVPRRDTAGEAGEFEFVGRVDGTAVFRIRGGQVSVDVYGGQPAQLRQVRFSQPLAASALRDIQVVKREGRGEVVLLEKPWQGNSFEAVVQVTDSAVGEGDYWFVVQWKK